MDDDYLSSNVRKRNLIFYLLLESEIATLRSHTIIGDLLFAFAMLLLGGAFSDKGSVVTWILLGCLSLLLSMFFYWERNSLLKKITSPRSIPKVAPRPRGESLKIVKAEYGAGSEWIDVTERVRRAVHPGSSVTVTNGLAGIDPVPHVVKWLRIEFEIDRKTFINEYLEGTVIVLPTGANA